MGARNIERILNEISEVRGCDEKVAVVIKATRRSQKVFTGSISEIIELSKKGLIRNPSVIIVGSVVDMREKILWKAAMS